MWIAQGATLSVPVTARVLSNGSPANAATVNYQITHGSGALSAASAQTSTTGYATANLQLSAINATVQVSVCVAPGNSPCLVFRAFAVPLNSLQLQAVSGTLQITASGNNLQPVIVRVLDSSSPPHSVFRARAFSFRAPQDVCRVTSRLSGQAKRASRIRNAGDPREFASHGRL